MVQYTLPINDFDGCPLLPFERVGPFPLELIRSLAFYPDYCSSGIWATLYQPGFDSIGDWLEMNVDAEDLPFKLDSDFLTQVQAMQDSFDAFAMAGEEETKDSSYDGTFWAFCVNHLQKRFKTLHPEYAYLIENTDAR